MSKNQQEISKLISYWLRHKPEEGFIKLDKFGWAEIQSVIKALKLNNFDFNESELIQLNESFDKVRWKIDLETKRIKATHGHSVSIEQELAPEIPGETLYHGTSINNINGILRKGLISGERQYVHLSDTKEMALEVGKRHGKPFLIEIDTEELIKNGWVFFKTEQNVWLTLNIPVQFLYFEPWVFNVSENRSKYTKEELKKEFRYTQKLYWIIDTLELIATSSRDDDVLFLDKDSLKLYVIHPTWSGKTERRNWPSVEKYKNMDEWMEKRFIIDQEDWYLDFET
ncbi:RNA 2'-phosphotransferase [Cellulophaga sp. 20_2_10]|uniref:RNA 2'-phosphotransferase n=1 Tax=Cellulophaga sp. 20_2_10 TaxID=2942476 RepID=UPI00201A485D|nr:RNA 2'-phosphotransferase [Cellulophaga sp. 20_2_10]